jgi:hypothetical protein
MRSQRDLSGLIKFLARDDWKSWLEDVMGEHFGAAMEAFDLEYDEIGAALGGGWDMTLWGIAPAPEAYRFVRIASCCA